MEASIINRADLAGTLIYEPSGCVYCANKGFKGRIGLYELLELRPEWIKAVSFHTAPPPLFHTQSGLPPS
jgi:type IV pilus assembly protein PilB